MKTNTFALFVLASIVFISCSATSETISTNSDTSSGALYPAWYNLAEFNQDSTTFYGFATAIASDSLTAIERARAQAKANLETRIGEITETVRTEMVEAGSSAAGNTDFIIILRAAHSKVQNEALLTNSWATFSETHFRAFVSVTITKESVVATLEDGFTGHPRYWGEFSNSAPFAVNFR